MDSMNTESVELEAKYHLFEDTKDDDNSIGTENVVGRHFIWLNKLISYFPIWTPKSISGKLKNKFLTIFMMLFIVVWICGNFFALNIYQIVISTDPIEQIIVTMIRTADYVSRSMGVYYFYYHFNYPWNSNVSGFVYQQQNEQNAFDLFCKKNVLLIKNTVILLCFVSFVIVSCYTVGGLYYGGSYVFWAILNFFYFGFHDMPLLALLSVQAAIFIKYACYISQLTTLISTDTNSMQDLITQYKILYKTFKKDHHPTLNYAIQVYLLFIVMQAWFIVYELTTHYREIKGSGVTFFIVWIVYYSWIFCTSIIYVVSSILLNETFEKFSATIWKSSDDSLKNNNDFLYLISYTQKYRISSRVGSLIITKKSMIRIIIGFGFAKLISYSIRYFE